MTMLIDTEATEVPAGLPAVLTPQSKSNDPAGRLVSADALLIGIAHGEANGTASIGLYLVTAAEQIAAHDREFTDTPKLYDWRFVLVNGRLKELGREAIKVPSGDSRDTQIAKARAITRLGVIERTRSGVIALLRAVAVVPNCQWKQKPLIAAAAAIGHTYDADHAATDDALRDAAIEAIDACAASTAKTLEGEFNKVVKLWNKLNESAEFSTDLRKANVLGERDAINKMDEGMRLMGASIAKLKSQEVLSR